MLLRSASFHGISPFLKRSPGSQLCSSGSSSGLVVRPSLFWGLRPQGATAPLQEAQPPGTAPSPAPPPTKSSRVIAQLCSRRRAPVGCLYRLAPNGAPSGHPAFEYVVAAELLFVSAPRLHPSELQIEQSKSTEAIGSSSFSVTIAIADKLLTLNLL